MLLETFYVGRRQAYRNVALAADGTLSADGRPIAQLGVWQPVDPPQLGHRIPRHRLPGQQPVAFNGVAIVVRDRDAQARQPPIEPGGEFVYEFDARPFGCHLYHCHTLPLKRHIHKGLYGTFIIDPDGRGPAIGWLRVPEEKTAKNRVHIDIRVAGEPPWDWVARADLIRAKVDELLAAGATKVREERYDDQSGHTVLGHVVMLDPEGNEFCVA